MIIPVVALISGQLQPSISRLEGDAAQTPTQQVELRRLEEPRVRFAPMAVRAMVRIVPGLSVSDCSVTLVGNPEPHWRDGVCRDIGERRILSATGLDGSAEGRMTALTILETDGRPLDVGATAGRLIFRSEVNFDVRPDGSIANCERGASVGTGDAIDLCQSAFPRRPDPFEPATDAQAHRTGRLSFSIYLDG